MNKTPLITIAAIAGLLIGAAITATVRLGNFLSGPDPETIAAASLQSVREQARLTAFAARFVAVVTSSQTRFGLSAQKTLIMPGTVRYEIDLTRLDQKDLVWSEDRRRLTVTLPPLQISRPEINLNEMREYSGGGVLLSLTDAEDRLDAANRQRGQQALVRQAGEALPMRLARDAAKRAVERTFAMPLKAAGVDAQVVTRFADEPGTEPSYLDRSRRVEDVLKEEQRSGTGR